jgi:hypothetical protein
MSARVNTAVEKAIWQFAVWASQLPEQQVIWELQNVEDPQRGRQPDKPFLTIEILNVTERYNPELKHKSLTEFSLINDQVLDIRFKIISLSGLHLSILNRVRSALRSQTAKLIFGQAGIAVWNIGMVNNTPIKLATRFMNCGFLDIDFAIRSTFDEDVGLIEKVIVEGAIKSENGITEVNYTIPPIQEEE